MFNHQSRTLCCLANCLLISLLECRKYHIVESLQAEYGSVRASSIDQDKTKTTGKKKSMSNRMSMAIRFHIADKTYFSQ